MKREWSKTGSGQPVELRSEEVQELMGQVPAWIVRWGATLLSLIILLLLAGSACFRYPEVVTGTMTLTGTAPAAQVVSRSSGRIRSLWVRNNQPVHAGEWLAVLENPATTEDVLYLEQCLLEMGHDVRRLGTALLEHTPLVLGDLQADYAGLLEALQEADRYHRLRYYPRKMAAVQDQMDRYRRYLEAIRRQRTTLAEQLALSDRQYVRDSLLYRQGILSAEDQESALSQRLERRHALEGAEVSEEQLGIQLGELEQTSLDLQLEQHERESKICQQVQRACETLLNSLEAWKLRYCLTAPVAGVVTFTNYWTENQYLPSGEVAFTVVPEVSGPVMGRVSLPMARSGRVRVGQRVLVRFANYPDEEYGVVEGRVAAISLVPTDAGYMADITFPQGLHTHYGIDLPVSPEAQATAEIVTQELTLLERLFMPVKRVIREGFAFSP